MSSLPTATTFVQLGTANAMDRTRVICSTRRVPKLSTWPHMEFESFKTSGSVTKCATTISRWRPQLPDAASSASSSRLSLQTPPSAQPRTDKFLGPRLDHRGSSTTPHRAQRVASVHNKRPGGQAKPLALQQHNKTQERRQFFLWRKCPLRNPIITFTFIYTISHRGERRRHHLHLQHLHLRHQHQDG